ncbi:MAG: glycoside hydrolase family 1 protein [Candidatus Pacebacteria bacterium]|nr:glycoside hydrolase family 1 protein [Candidatus Paceibacterota bacterium]
MRREFPKGFFWGASTSAHQVEGGTHNDWSEWEKENAKRLAESAGVGTDVWKSWESRDRGRFPEMLEEANYISGRAADHYNRFEKDFDIAKSLGHNAHRFSIEWSRIEPEEGKFDEKEIEHYRTVIAALRARGMEPFVTLWHWPIPLWLEKKGGLESREFVSHFTRYTEKVVAALGADVVFWITLNEPEVVAGHAYLKGCWPPQKKSYSAYRRVIRNLIRAHKAAYTVIKESHPEAKVCVAKHNIYFESAGGFINKALKWVADRWWNDWFLNETKGYQDVITLNHYHRNRINYGFNEDHNERISDMGWELHPESLAQMAREMHEKYKLPIYVTEHGLADADDSHREWFITESLKHLHHAIEEGVDVRGYLHWSLLDNFEWDKGFWPRFGLVAVDFKTQERKVRPSAQVYKKVCESNVLEL